jgi:hypothetical protein
MAARRRTGRRPPRPLRSPHHRADGQPKTRFRSEQDANRAAFSYRLNDGVELVAYECHQCGGWHLGNSPER